jgi:hypothetical protein
MDNADEGAPRVGYKSPPRHAQFQKGRSGNPRGRPKKKPSLIELIERELDSYPTLKDGSKGKHTFRQIAAKKMVHDLASGSRHAFSAYRAMQRSLPFEPTDSAQAFDHEVDADLVKFWFAASLQGAGDE